LLYLSYDFKVKTMHTFLYSLRTYEGRSILDYSLGLKIVFETPKELKVELPQGIVTLSKFHYLNKFKVYQDTKNAKVFFIVCNKQVSAKSAFDFLMKYAISKIDNSISEIETKRSNLFQIKSKLLKEIAA
jgi:hypothetical protein